MPQVEMQRTQQSQQALADALLAELRLTAATRTTGALLLALINQETTSGKDLWNFNVGNVTTPDTSLNYWSPSKGKAKGLRFRAYESLDDGVRDFVRFVQSRPRLWVAASAGDVSQFAQQIRDTKYNPDLDVAEATPQLLTLAKRAVTLFPSLSEGTPITSGTAQNWNGLVLLGLLWFCFGRNR